MVLLDKFHYVHVQYGIEPIAVNTFISLLLVVVYTYIVFLYCIYLLILIHLFLHTERVLSSIQRNIKVSGV